MFELQNLNCLLSDPAFVGASHHSPFPECVYVCGGRLKGPQPIPNSRPELMAKVRQSFKFHNQVPHTGISILAFHYGPGKDDPPFRLSQVVSWTVYVYLLP